jgi:8-oxo-dGTP pyrophosphatase MutT (NUDIX family)
MSFDLPRDAMLPVDAVDVVLDPGPHPFETDNREEIAQNWLREKAAKPALFDGTMVLLAGLAYRDRKLAGRCHAVRYSTFMHWRNNRTIAGVGHAFAHPMLVSSDNALVAIRMAAHTVNAGRVYFASGSFEPEDFPDGRVDLHRNMARELMEETGLDLDAARGEVRHYALATAHGTVICRRYHFDADAGELALRIEDFVARDRMPEISGPVVIRGVDDLPEGLMPHMKRLVGWHFSGAGE